MSRSGWRYHIDFDSSTQSRYNLNGIDAEYYRDVPSFDTYDQVAFVFGDYFYAIQNNSLDDAEFKQILDTFRFISGVRGQVLLGPICPVERIPPDPACAPKPYPTDIEIQADQGNGYVIIKTIATDGQARYSVMLEPGEYILTPVGGQPFPRCDSSDVGVVADNFTELNLSCDTGIR